MAERDPEYIARWLGWTSPLFPVWAWHATLDGTRLCRCAHSREYRASQEAVLRG